MKNLADTSPLAGRHFVSSSGNVATVEVLGAGGLAVDWTQDHTEADRAEFHKWAAGVIGPLNITEYYTGGFDIAKRAKRAKRAFDEWRKS